MSSDTTWAFGPQEHVDASRTIDFTELREEYFRRSGGRHLWAVGLIFRLDDPETALDDLSVGGDELIGTHGFYCVACHVPYRTVIRHGFCPARPGPAMTDPSEAVMGQC